MRGHSPQIWFLRPRPEARRPTHRRMALDASCSPSSASASPGAVRGSELPRPPRTSRLRLASPPYHSMPQQPRTCPRVSPEARIPRSRSRPLELVALLALVIRDLALWHEGRRRRLQPRDLLRRAADPRSSSHGRSGAAARRHRRARCARRHPAALQGRPRRRGALRPSLARRTRSPSRFRRLPTLHPDILGSIFASIGRIPSRTRRRLAAA